LAQLNPLVSSYGPIQPIDRNAVRSMYGLASITWGLVFIFFAGLEKSGSKFNFKNAFILIILGCLLVDSVLPERFSQNGPIAGLARILPGLYYSSNTALVWAIFLLITIMDLASRGSRLAGSLLPCFLLIYPLGISFYKQKTITLPIYARSNLALRIPAYCKNNPLMVTPSLSVINRYNLWFICKINANKTSLSLDLNSSNSQVKTSFDIKPKRTRKILDQRLDTHWSTKENQNGSEWIKLDLLEPKNIVGLTLHTGKWKEQTPNSLSIKTFTTSCKDIDPKSDAEAEPVFSESFKIGIKLTNELVPYLTTKEDVSVVFPEQHLTRCIFISQTKTKNRPWSIAKISINNLETQKN